MNPGSRTGKRVAAQTIVLVDALVDRGPAACGDAKEVQCNSPIRRLFRPPERGANMLLDRRSQPSRRFIQKSRIFWCLRLGCCRAVGVLVGARKAHRFNALVKNSAPVCVCSSPGGFPGRRTCLIGLNAPGSAILPRVPIHNEPMMRQIFPVWPGFQGWGVRRDDRQAAWACCARFSRRWRGARRSRDQPIVPLCTGTDAPAPLRRSHCAPAPGVRANCAAGRLLLCGAGAMQ